MGFYEKYILPPILDKAMQQEPIMRQRAKVIPGASGVVLEIGVGCACVDSSSVIEKIAINGRANPNAWHATIVPHQWHSRNDGNKDLDSEHVGVS